MNIQAQKLIAPYLGKWMRITGFVEDMSRSRTFISVYLVRKETLGVRVAIYFHTDWLEKLELFKPGDGITLIGQITHIRTRYNMDLENCELLDYVPTVASSDFKSVQEIMATLPRNLLETISGWRQSYEAVNNSLEQTALHNWAELKFTIEKAEITPVDRYRGTPRFIAIRRNDSLTSLPIVLNAYFNNPDITPHTRVLAYQSGATVTVRGQITRADLDIQRNVLQINIDLRHCSIVS